MTVQQAGPFVTSPYVLDGTLGGGSQPIVVSDSFVVDASTSDEGRNVVTTTIPEANAVVRTVTPSAPGLTFQQSRLTSRTWAMARRLAMAACRPTSSGAG